MSDTGVNFCTVKIDDKKCEHCYECIKGCMTGALTVEKGIFMHNSYECAYCEYCMDCCLNNALQILEM